MVDFKYEKGVVDFGSGAYGYLQPDGSWGFSNAGLILDEGDALLVDTLFDEPLTREMLRALQAASGVPASDIGVLVNTHANGDHTNGNALLEHAEIIASAASARELSEVTPALLAQMKAAGEAGQGGEGAAFFARVFAPFDFLGARGKAPTRTFSDRLTLRVGAKRVELLEVGPAHTAGDVLVYSPSDRTIYTGDILFIDGTPIMWAGPVENWLRACDYILGLDVDVIVPGHGPVTDKRGVSRVREYLVYVDEEARKRFDAGMSAEEAALDIALGEYDAWGDSERIAVNVERLFAGYRGDLRPPDPIAMFARMAKIHGARRRRRVEA